MAATTLTTSILPTSTLEVENGHTASNNEFIYYGSHGKAILIGLAATVAILFSIVLCMACCWPKEKKKNERGGYVTTTYWNGTGNKGRCC